ncbi:MAG: hypothetical protein PHT80_12250, partial [Lentisphaeria bacterium]|nr:hypothetical protein [Lentisphaeria bacterium]
FRAAQPLSCGDAACGFAAKCLRESMSPLIIRSFLSLTWGPLQIASGSDYLDTNLFMPDAVDSPCSEGLTLSYLNYETSTTFSTWLMYKPNSPGAIFVPLRKIDWFWSGKATRSGTTWSLTASEKPPAAPTSTTTVDFPEWTHNIDYVQLQFQ